MVLQQGGSRDKKYIVKLNKKGRAAKRAGLPFLIAINNYTFNLKRFTNAFNS